MNKKTDRPILVLGDKNSDHRTLLDSNLFKITYGIENIDVDLITLPDAYYVGFIKSPDLYPLIDLGTGQINKLVQYKILTKERINTPDSLFISHLESYKRVIDISDEERVYKPVNQARGIGVHKISNKTFFEMCRYLNTGGTAEAFNDTFNLKPHGRSEAELQHFVTNIDRSAYLSTELINFNKEFRIILGYNVPEIVVEERFNYIDSEENSRVELSGKDFKIKYTHIVKRLKEFIVKYKKPFMSFDVYVKEDGITWGVFEYSTQFGADYIEQYHDLTTIVNEGIMNVIKLENPYR